MLQAIAWFGVASVALAKAVSAELDLRLIFLAAGLIAFGAGIGALRGKPLQFALTFFVGIIGGWLVVVLAIAVAGHIIS
jgi:hypothetical protein